MVRKGMVTLAEEDRVERERNLRKKEAREQRQKMVDRLLNGDIFEYNRQEFGLLLRDDLLMEDLKRALVDKFYRDSKDYELLSELKFLLQNMDKEIWLNIRRGNLTLRQVKTRVIERMDGYQHRYNDFDDIKHQLPPEMDKIHTGKAMQYIKAAFGKDLHELPKECLVEKLEPWQSNYRCLRSIKHLGASLYEHPKSGQWELTKG